MDKEKTTRQRLAEWSKTPEGRESYEKVAEEMRREISEKPMNQDGLEEEAVSYCFDNGLNISPRVATDFARHFYDLGCRRTAEKYDEIEYNRQREGEK